MDAGIEPDRDAVLRGADLIEGNKIGTSIVKTVCIVGASGKLGRYMVKHCLDRGYQVRGVCREKMVGLLVI